MRENYGMLGDDLYTLFVKYISDGRDWDANHTQDIIDNGPYFLPQDAITAGLADSIMYPDQFEDYIKSLNDEKIEIIKWEDIDRSDEYVYEWSPKKKEKIAIINLGKIQSLLDAKRINSETKINLDLLKKANIIRKSYKKIKIIGT